MEGLDHMRAGLIVTGPCVLLLSVLGGVLFAILHRQMPCTHDTVGGITLREVGQPFLVTFGLLVAYSMMYALLYMAFTYLSPYKLMEALWSLARKVPAALFASVLGGMMFALRHPRAAPGMWEPTLITFAVLVIFITTDFNVNLVWTLWQRRKTE